MTMWIFIFNIKITHKINSAKAAMSDLTKISEELFWVFLKEEFGNFGVLQAPRPTAVGHNGERGRDVAAARNYLGLRQRLQSPHRWLICRTSVSYVFSWKTVMKFSTFMHILFLLCCRSSFWRTSTFLDSFRHVWNYPNQLKTTHDLSSLWGKTSSRQTSSLFWLVTDS